MKVDNSVLRGHANLRTTLLASFLILGGCTTTRPSAASASVDLVSDYRTSPLLSFFEGRSRGDGVLRVIFRSPRNVHVETVGTLDAEGGLRLVQQIHEQRQPARSREGRLWQVTPGRLAGSLSDARGPVTGSVSGNRMRLRYRIADRLTVDQRVTLAPGGRTAHNRSTISRMGIVVATLDETITKLD